MEIELGEPGMKTRKGNMAETGKDGVYLGNGHRVLIEKWFALFISK